MTSKAETRRGVFRSVGRTGAGVALAGLAAGVESARGYAANDTLNVGCIGTGGRCRTLMQSLAKVPGVRIAAVCDIYDKHLDAGKALADPKAFATARLPPLPRRDHIDAALNR